MPFVDFESLRRTVEEAVASNDVTSALAVVRPVARAAAAEHGSAFRDLISSLPEDAWHDDVVIASAMGSSFRAAGSPRGSAAIGYFHAAEAALEGAPRDRDPDRVTVWLGQAAALRALGRLGAAQSYVDRARSLDGSGSILSVPVRVELGARSTLEAGMIALETGRFGEARRFLEHVSGLADAHLIVAERMECLGALAILEYVQANMDTAGRHIRDALDLGVGSALLETGYAGPALAAAQLMAVDQHDLAAAGATEVLLMAAAGRNDWEPFSYIVAAYLRVQRGQFAEALDFLQRSRPLYRTWDPPALGAAIGEELRAGILIALDHADEAWTILRDLEPFEHHVLCPARITAGLRLVHGDLRGASEILQACEALGDDHSPRTLMEVRMLRAAIEYERGEFAASDVAFDRALATMARTGSRAALRVIPSGTLRGLASRALARSHGVEATRILTRVAEATDGSDRLIEALSHRELLVLAEVEKGSTVAGIAAALYISPNTVKTHLRRLYKKLGVSTRADAIRKAKSLGLGQSVTRDSPVPQAADNQPG